MQATCIKHDLGIDVHSMVLGGFLEKSDVIVHVKLFSSGTSYCNKDMGAVSELQHHVSIWYGSPDLFWTAR